MPCRRGPCTEGETTWGRIESNGQLEVNGTGYGNPSKCIRGRSP